MTRRLAAEEWQAEFIDAFEAELKDRLVTLSLKEWEWKILIDALKVAGKKVSDTSEGPGKP